MSTWVVVLVVVVTCAVLLGITLAATALLRPRMPEAGQRGLVRLTPRHEGRLVGLVIGIVCVAAIPIAVFDETRVEVLGTVGAALVAAGVAVLYVRRNGQRRRIGEP